ncbi:MAG: DMT family transporter [Candidatus Hodarchaeota archaeon]
MENNIKKGIIFGTFGVFLIGLQPVIANSRPSIIDPYIFAAFTALIEAIIFLPLFFFERKKLKLIKETKSEELEKIDSLLNGWKKKENVKLLIIIGLTFTLVPILLYIGYELAGATNSTITLKSEIIFALIFGFIFLGEKITKIQIVFCVILFFGLLITITQGFSNLLELNVGVLILILSVVLFTLIHTLTKEKFDKNQLFPTQIIFIRNLLSSITLISIYLIFFPFENLYVMINPRNFIFFLLMGLDYGFSLFFWYKTLTCIQIGTATIINSLTPFTAALFSFIILGDIFTIFHLIGTLIIIFSIIMIVREENKLDR